MNACENCRFWNSDRQRIKGTCHRMPPQPNYRDDDARWPMTMASETCGEWRAK